MMWLRTAYIAVVLLIVTLVLLPLQLLGLAFDWRLRRRIPRVWHRIACHVLGIRVHVHGEAERAKPLMLAVNHASWKDILVLGSIADVVFIAKTEVRDWPVFGWLARLQKSIFVQREQKRSTGMQVSEIASRMADGEIVVLFPEGTTSDGNRMLAVKSSLFGAASTAAEQVPGKLVYVQPVAIAYTRLHGMAMGRYHRVIAAWPGSITLVPHLLGIIKAGAIDVDVTFGDSVPFHCTDNRKRLATDIAASIRSMLAFSLRGGWRNS
ncbi:lysophospholipid acyltransferase family protein [Agrobacterium pusense]|uniref:lysophospholipid acyltransferase family protein n=1 Tax=Agrobacterium pusense TaxID=648995 RepID=UPI0005143D5D|nr:1-acyl-sn-glycerol-3-phosphate acyltransferase [Agrobacterium pusense]ANV24313.1 acyl-phosphate glycerol 3-phosphate acyltransferase [Rhizobium sp. S41]KGE84085.1 acyl-phosphate glycerol 3-phosphate acyltransferase [Rhizobium sp. H41]QWW73964.1 1-acyl-sn-glycerol-3-phosphate acyltransferase [Agrobacterium pusense]